MNTSELQRLKMAWLAAKESGDTETQLRILQDYPAEQAELIDFIAAYHATESVELEENASLLPLTQRAAQSALERVFTEPLAITSLAELRKSRQMTKTDVAKGLRLTVDVWNKFESGAIELFSLSHRQMERFAQFFQVNIDQFSRLLEGSQPAFTLNRRQSPNAARNEQQGPQRQTFGEAISRSMMSKDDKSFWLEQ